VRDASLRRTATMLARRDALPAGEAANLTRLHLAYERAVVESMTRFFEMPADVRAASAARLNHIARLVDGPDAAAAPSPEIPPAGRAVYRRNAHVPGPVSVFGYDYLLDHYGAERAARLRLLGHTGAFGANPVGGGAYAYEVLNLVDGARTTQQIRDAVSAILGPVPLEYVVEYIEALREIGLVERVR
jgi:aminopeptidase YwaD